MKLDTEEAQLVAFARERERWSWPKFIGWLVFCGVFGWVLFG